MSQTANPSFPFMEWTQPKASEKYFELRDQGLIIGSMRFRSSSGTLAVVQSDSRQWSFKRIGFTFPKVTLRNEGDEGNIAEYQPKVWGD